MEPERLKEQVAVGKATIAEGCKAGRTSLAPNDQDAVKTRDYTHAALPIARLE